MNTFYIELHLANVQQMYIAAIVKTIDKERGKQKLAWKDTPVPRLVVFEVLLQRLLRAWSKMFQGAKM